MKEKILMKGLNTIIYPFSSKDKIDQFLSSLKSREESSDNIVILRTDKIKFDYDSMSRIAMGNYANGTITIISIEVSNIVGIDQYKYSSKLKDPLENYGLLEASHVVLVHDFDDDKFTVVKHRNNKDILHKKVDYDDLI